MAGITLRGLATIDVDTITDAELDELHKAGVRGTRLHQMAWDRGYQAGVSEIISKVRKLSERLGCLGWVIGINCNIRAWAAMAPAIRTELDPRIKLVADHLGGTFPGEERGEEFKTFIELIREKRIYVKLSGFERLFHDHEEGMTAIEPIVRAFIAAGPDRIMFGTGMLALLKLDRRVRQLIRLDWPHTQLGVARKGKTQEQRLADIEGFREVDDEDHIRVLREWITDDKVWQDLWVNNPEKIFG
jgi:hypothetical protein